MILILIAWIVDAIRFGPRAVWNAESRDLARSGSLSSRPISVRISVDYVTRDQINSGGGVDQERFKHDHRNKPTEPANSIDRPCPLLITFRQNVFQDIRVSLVDSLQNAICTYIQYIYKYNYYIYTNIFQDMMCSELNWLWEKKINQRWQSSSEYKVFRAKLRKKKTLKRKREKFPM